MDEIHWTKTAGQDLRDIGSYIALDSPRTAEKIIRRIFEAVAMLAFHPKIGRASENGDTWQSIVRGTPCIAVYRLRERIEVITIFHGSRQWPQNFSNL